MRKRTLLFALVMVTALLGACGNEKSDGSTVSASGDGKLKKIVIAEPLHSTGYLPCTSHSAKAISRKEGWTSRSSKRQGSARNRRGQRRCLGRYRRTESNALANNNNSDPIISVVNVVNRANVYLMAKKGTAPASDSPRT